MNLISNLTLAAVSLCLFAMATATAIAQSESPPKQPNILLIFLDDLGYTDVEFNAKLFGVETDAITPNIDALAKQGTIFKFDHPVSALDFYPTFAGLAGARLPEEKILDGKTHQDP